MKQLLKNTPFLLIITLILVGLKLGGVINWSWWLVTLPSWGPLALAAVIFVAMVVSESNRMMK